MPLKASVGVLEAIVENTVTAMDIASAAAKQNTATDRLGALFPLMGSPLSLVE